MLILLDIDGVMVPIQNWKAPEMLSDGFPNFSPKAVAALNQILKATGARILLTTTHKSSFSTRKWESIFANRGISAEIGKIHDREGFFSRKEEIVEWFHLNGNQQAFVVLDDDKMLNGLPKELKDRLVLTKSMLGLDEEAANDAIAILNRQERAFSHLNQRLIITPRVKAKPLPHVGRGVNLAQPQYCLAYPHGNFAHPQDNLAHPPVFIENSPQQKSRPLLSGFIYWC